MPMTFDQATVDGTGAFLVHELERLDQTLNLPLVSYTWSRDTQLREDVSIADEISSFTNTTFAAAGTPNANGKNWLSKTATNAAKTWATSTADEIRASINAGLSAAWANSAYSMVPTDLLIPPEQFSLLASTIVSSAGNQSLLTYLETNTIAYHQNGRPLNIRPVKWAKGRGVSNSDRMMFYTNDKKYVRFPMVPLMSVPIQYRGLYQLVTYYGKLGAVEPVYPETLAYVDGI